MIISGRIKCNPTKHQKWCNYPPLYEAGRNKRHHLSMRRNSLPLIMYATQSWRLAGDKLYQWYWTLSILGLYITQCSKLNIINWKRVGLTLYGVECTSTKCFNKWLSLVSVRGWCSVDNITVIGMLVYPYYDLAQTLKKDLKLQFS